jgi:hypothetical protein
LPFVALTSAPVYANTGEYDCSDGIDNDGDGYTDMSDPFCIGSEAGFCSDGIDNDGDANIDTSDSDCAVPNSFLTTWNTQ